MVDSPLKMDNKDSAVRTLGSGDLSLSQLGLADPTSSEAVAPVTPRFHDGAETSVRPRSEPVETLPAAPPSDPGSEDITAVSRARTFHDPSASAVVFNDLSSPSGSVYEEKPNNGLGRSGSVKSALGRRSRNRGSSNTTGISSQASASAINLTTPFPHGTASSSGPKLTGFAIASKKRNRDFHTLFKSVPDDDYLIEDYSCALQREILAHGRLYVSEGHLCFSSNIFGWVTTLVMSFGEIVSVEKRSTALLFKNGLMITTLHAKHVFASFTSRDATYDLIVNIWKLGHPSLQSSLNGIRLEGTGGDKTEKIDAPATLAEEAAEEEEAGSGTEEDSEEEDVYDEDDDEEVLPDITQVTDASMIEAAESDKAVSRKPSGTTNPAGATPEQPSGEVFPTTAGVAADFPGPATHAPTDCGDSATHYDRVVADEIVPAPLGQVYNKLFGPESVTWMTKWLQVDQKCTELQMEDKKGLTQENKTRTFSYIKPLNGSFGPRSTKCIVTETLDQLDLEKAVSISCSTLTPDVPSGNVFSTKTKYCLTWAENNSTRFQASCTVEWTGKSWIKGEHQSRFPAQFRCVMLTPGQVRSRRVAMMVRYSTAKSLLLLSSRPWRVRVQALGMVAPRRARAVRRRAVRRPSLQSTLPTARAAFPRGVSSRQATGAPWNRCVRCSSQLRTCSSLSCPPMSFMACSWACSSLGGLGSAQRVGRRGLPKALLVTWLVLGLLGTQTGSRHTRRCGVGRRATCGSGSRSASAATRSREKFTAAPTEELGRAVR